MAARIESAIKNPSQTSFTSRYCAKSNVYSCNNVEMSCTKHFAVNKIRYGLVHADLCPLSPDELM